ncbi:MAG: MoxR family ATPase, partial [Acidimicrobiales bacterium]|nr:MoxR family ATPase [Acidimicrobiales bacterium]
QNPIENEGTYPLPESQLDRFLLKVSVGYPAREAELAILEGHRDHDPLADLEPVVSVAQVNGLAAAARTVHVAPALAAYLVDLAEASRRHREVAVGMSPRATLALQRVACARAAARGRSYATPDDVKAVAEPVVAHRLLLRASARSERRSGAAVVEELLAEVPQPDPRPVAHGG